MSRSALLLLFLAACAAPQQRRDFRDGAPVRAPVVEPRTAYTPNGAGLPEYWGAPDAQKPERSPYTRTLPQTPATMREPGIWASDTGGHAPPYPQVHLLGIVLEPHDNPTEYEWDTVAMCAITMDSVGRFELDAIARLPIWPKACAIAKLYRHCAEGVMREANRKKASGEEYHAVAMDALRRVIEAAKKQEKISCKTEPTAGTMAAIRAISTRWSEEHENQ